MKRWLRRGALTCWLLAVIVAAQFGLPVVALMLSFAALLLLMGAMEVPGERK